MKTNHVYNAAIASGMEKAAMGMQPMLKRASRKLLHSNAREITDYVVCLLDIREECSLNPEETPQLTAQEQEICDRATD